MKYLIVFLVMAMMVLGGTSSADDKDDITVRHWQKPINTHNSVHHFHGRNGVYVEYYQFLWHKMMVVDSRLDMLEALNKDIYIATCSNPGRNVAACTRMAANIKAITDFEDRHKEAFCTSDMLRMFEKAAHDRNFPETASYYIALPTHRLCLSDRKKGRSAEYYTSLLADYNTYLQSQRVIDYYEGGTQPATTYNHLKDFVLWRAEFRQPE